MGRRVKDVLITAEGRDKGKTFLLTEMPASQAEKWACRAMLLAAQAGVDIDNAMSGFAGLVIAGIQTVMGGIKFGDLEPLMDEMFGCIQVRPDPRNPNPERALLVRKLMEDDIEEVATRLQLRGEVLELHLGFTLADARSKLAMTAPAAGSPPTPTSPPASEPSSPGA